MTKRELSEKLCELACELDDLSDGNQSNADYRRALIQIAAELHDLSNNNFTPGHTSWADVKKQANAPTRKPKYVNTHGRELPF